MSGDDEVREANRSDRVGMLGLVSDGRLEDELRSAALGVVTQCPGLPEFNLPSKLMNYMAYGVPEVAAVEPGSEVARIIESSGAGWVGLTCSASVSGEEPLSRRGSIEPAGEPLVVLLDDHACGEPGQRSVVGEDADDVGAPTTSRLRRSSGLVAREGSGHAEEGPSAISTYCPLSRSSYLQPDRTADPRAKVASRHGGRGGTVPGLDRASDARHDGR